MDWKTKYLKYKIKYNKLIKEQHGGNKQTAKQLAEYVSQVSSKSNLFEEIMKMPLNSDPILNIVINSNAEKESCIQKLFFKISQLMPKLKYTHNIIRKDNYLISSFENKTYSSATNADHHINICSNAVGAPSTVKYHNSSKSGIDTIRDQLFINNLPDFTTLSPISTYNYVLMFVTDLITNQTYYYFVFVEYTSFIEYSIKHSNLRVFLPEEWSYHDNIDHGFIATGELKIVKGEQKIIYDFNSSSNIIEMLEGRSHTNSIIFKKFVDKYISPDIKCAHVPDQQLFSLTYLFIINDLVNRTIKGILTGDYQTFKVEIHPDYLNKAKLLQVAKGNENEIYTRGLLKDPHPLTLGGLHNYSNRRCYTDDEMRRFNTNTIKNYDDLDDSNIDFSKLNCIKKSGEPVLVDSSNPSNDDLFKASINCA